MRAIDRLFVVFAFSLIAGPALADVEVDIPSQPVGDALNQFAEQSGLQVVMYAGDAEGVETEAVQGTYEEPTEVLDTLLASTGLEYAFINDRTVSVSAAIEEERGASDSKNLNPQPMLMAQNQTNPTQTTRSQEQARNTERPNTKPKRVADFIDSAKIQADEELAKDSRGLIETIYVYGSRNSGVRRFEDDTQPYVVFNSDALEQSGALNLHDFLRTRLPMNTVQGSNTQFSGSTIGNTSEINLRGLGADQTLILVNGRRAPRISLGNSYRQADINGIPMRAIERIEVLPSTASGIYGGGATGGVINIILRRSYVGAEISAEYGNTFDSDYSTRRIDGSFGFSLENGRTNVQVSASYSDANELHAGDRPFSQASRELLFQNDPSIVGSLSTPPFGATPNIRVFGSEENLVLDGGIDLGSDRTFVPVGYSGVSSDGGQALIANAGNYNLAVPNSFDGTEQIVLQSPVVSAFSVNARREFHRRVEAFVDIFVNRNEGQSRSGALPRFLTLDADDPGNPFENRISVSFPSIGPEFDSESRSEAVLTAAGLNIQFENDWHMVAEYSWNRSRFEQFGTSTGFNNTDVTEAIRSGEIDIFVDTNVAPAELTPFAFSTPTRLQFPRDNILENFALRASGPLIELPAGKIRWSTLAEYRDEQIEGSFERRLRSIRSPVPGEFDLIYTPQRGQSVSSVYAEALVPILSKELGISWLSELELQASVRYDDYETQSPMTFARVTVDSKDSELPDFERKKNEFSSTDYTIGVSLKPIDAVQFRASFGTGFLPPSVNEIFSSLNVDRTLFLTDPQRENDRVRTLVPEWRSVGNENLRPETSESVSAGVIITPSALPGLRVSIDYTKIKKTDEISSISPDDVLSLESELPDRVVRGELTPEDEALGYTAGPILFLDSSLINLARTNVEAFDFQINQELDLGNFGLLDLYAVATRMNTADSQILSNSEVRDSIGFDGGILEWRANLGLDWYSPSQEWQLSWNAQFYDEYKVYSATSSESVIERNILRQGSDHIPSETYHDLTVIYRPNVLTNSRFANFLEDLRVQLAVQNVFDKVPTIRAASGSFDTIGRYSQYGDVRLRRYSLSITKSF